MIYATENTSKNYEGSELTEYEFHANRNPVYWNAEREYVTVKIPAPSEAAARQALSFLVGSMSKARDFFLADTKPYD